MSGKVAVSPKGGPGSKPGLSGASVLTFRRLIKSINRYTIKRHRPKLVIQFLKEIKKWLGFVRK